MADELMSGSGGSSTELAQCSDDQQQQKRALLALSKWRRNRISTGMDQILPGLFVGGLRDAMDAVQLAENGVKAIVSVHGFSRDCNFGTVADVLRVGLNDSSDENVIKHFAVVNSFIHSHRLRQDCVLIHCLAGASRSVCLCLAYLMTITNLDYPNALDYVSRRRHCANPNFGFKMQLMKFGQKFVQNERQRLFAEFHGKMMGDEFCELYQDDCIFTNSLFVSGAEVCAKQFHFQQKVADGANSSEVKQLELDKNEEGVKEKE